MTNELAVLKARKMIENDTCKRCNQTVETYEHIWECIKTKGFLILLAHLLLYRTHDDIAKLPHLFPLHVCIKLLLLYLND